MKIGIVTFWWSQENYGQLLQCFATQKYLQQLGHEAFLIKYKYIIPGHEDTEKRFCEQIQKFFSYPHWKYFLATQYKKFSFAFINRFVQNHNINRHFTDFFQMNIKSSPICYSQAELIENPPSVDVLVCGSDMVWGGKGVDPIFFLGFGGKHIRRISVAASFGCRWESMNNEEKSRIKILLERFDGLSLREDEGVRICQNLGYANAIKICDPTMLLDRTVYESMTMDFSPIDYSNKVFIYLLCNERSVMSDKAIMIFLNGRNIMCNYAASQDAVNTLPKIFPTIPEWLANIRYSDFVITNSFHGTVLSLLFQKDFMVIPLENEDRNTRINSLLGMLHLQDRICRSINDLARCFDHRIDYSIINPLLDKFREFSRNTVIGFLKDS